MHRFILVIASSLLLLVASCDNDVPVNAPREQNAVVYGLLDKGDSVHYIKVNKDFISKDKSAREVAGNRDSILFGSGIRVRLQELRGGDVQESHVLTRDTLDEKRPGLFPSPQHVIYRTPELDLDVNAAYKLVIDRMEDEEPVTAETNIVRGVNLETPKRNRNIPQPATLPIASSTDEIEFRLSPNGDNAHFYSVFVNTVVTSIDTAKGTRTTDTVRWRIFEQQVVDGELQTTADRQTFFRILQSGLESKPDVIRPVGLVKANVRVAAGTEDLYTYLQVTEPSLSIVQKRPEFTNLSDGRGIFTSRRLQRFEFGFTPGGRDSLRLNRFTRDLGFVE
jgi:hypothetical protein